MRRLCVLFAFMPLVVGAARLDGCSGGRTRTVPEASSLRSSSSAIEGLFLSTGVQSCWLLISTPRSGFPSRAIPGIWRWPTDAEIWGCFGSVGNADDATPSATTWHSPDEGRTSTKVGLTLPADAGLTPALLKRLPLEFINEATDPPLLLMFDGGLMSPAPGRDYDEWRPVGHVPTARRPASGVQHRGTIYVAAENRIFMSKDSAATWSSQPVHEFSRAEIRCQGDVCYALLIQGGSESNTVVTAAANTNQWKPLGSLEVPELAAALREETVERGPIARFGASAILARLTGVRWRLRQCRRGRLGRCRVRQAHRRAGGTQGFAAGWGVGTGVGARPVSLGGGLQFVQACRRRMDSCLACRTTKRGRLCPTRNCSGPGFARPLNASIVGRTRMLLWDDGDQVTTSPTAGEAALAASLGSTGLAAIDAAILKATRPRWFKVARVVVDAIKDGGFATDDDPVQLHVRRLIALVHAGKLEAQGNLLRPRFSEVRLPA